MIKQLEKLTEEELALLLRAPVLLSVLASSGDHEISRKEKAEAIKLVYLKTFTADPLLLPYYKEVEPNFKINFEEIVKQYAPFDDSKREVLKDEINVLYTVITKLDKEYAETLLHSLSRFAEHVKKSDHSFLENFIFPIPIKGLTD